LKTRNKPKPKERAIAPHDELKWRKNLGRGSCWHRFVPSWTTSLKAIFADETIDSITAQDICAAVIARHAWALMSVKA
jgi:hypothetical protein